ncbi:MAG: TPM domain-containing protein [Treponema sp.]
MVAKKSIYALLIFFCISLSSYAESVKKLLVDEAGVLQPDIFTKIEKHLQTVSHKSGSDAVIVIVSDTGEKIPQDYADDYFDDNGYGQGSEKEGSLLLIVTGDGSPGSRYIYISTHGKKTIEALTDVSIERLLDTLIAGGLKDNQYLSSIDSYLTALSRRFYNTLSVVDVAISLGAAIVFFLLKFFGTIKKYKNKGARSFVPFYDVNKNSIVSFTTVNDTFLSSKTVSRVIKLESGSGSRSGSTTRTSSRGETHGGGGRSF